ncbi:cadherin-like protein 26, partial [Python bivittatus]|uniref:Cadherin-like protein 26 n=1 Tax=Python bivittatus TaxID=176946 RepID=A0A9F3W2Y7_PYTBI
AGCGTGSSGGGGGGGGAGAAAPAGGFPRGTETLLRQGKPQLQVLAIHSFHYTLGKDVSVNKDHFKRSNQDGGPFHSLHSLHRVKRKWHYNILEVEEEDKNFPKLIGGVSNDVSQGVSVKYSMNKLDVPGLFFIKETCGQIYVNGCIDRETTPSFPVYFEVRHEETEKMLDNPLFFTIQIKDINDNAPEFLHREFNINIKENHNKNEPVFIITATDKDQEGTANSEVAYFLLSQTPHLNPSLFTMDSSSGLIHITGCLDYEADRTFKLLIRASDHGSPSLSSTATINIALEDSNNNLPVFIQENYHTDVPEGTTKDDILRLKVEDKDSPNTRAWRAKYTIKSGNKRGNFAIVTDLKTNEGVLSVIKPLVYDSPSVRILVIVVENEEPFFLCERGLVSIIAPPQLSEVSVSINVTDQNDAPQFNPPILNRQEGIKAGTRLVQYEAQDSHTAQDKLRYKIVSDPGGWVKISDTRGVVTTAKILDRESPFVNNRTYTYTIVIHAIDDGVPPLTGTGTIVLYLSDLNDNPPMLVTSSLMICVEKGNGPFHIKAEDKDSYPYAEPFTFLLEEGIKNSWKLEKSSGNSVDLFMRKILPLGNYSVPLRILDMQSFYKQQSLHVRVCSCLNRIICEKDPEAQLLVGGLSGGIVAIFLLCILGLGFLWWYFRIHARVEKHLTLIPYGEANQTLIHYKEESQPQDVPDLGNHATPTSLPTIWRENQKTREEFFKQNVSGAMPVKHTENHQHPTGSVTSPFYTINAWKQLDIWNHRYNKTRRKNSQDNFLETVAVLLKRKCNDITNLEDNMVYYRPHTYAEEGILEKSKSLLSLLVPEDDKDSLPDNFLDALESTFVPLRKICSK